MPDLHVVTHMYLMLMHLKVSMSTGTTVVVVLYVLINYIFVYSMFVGVWNKPLIQIHFMYCHLLWLSKKTWQMIFILFFINAPPLIVILGTFLYKLLIKNL